MTRVSPEIFLSRPSDVEVEGKELDAALKDAVSSASRVSILSGYHGPEYVLELLKSVPRRRRRDCRVDLVFGFEHERDYVLSRVALTELASRLRSLEFRKLSLSSFRSRRPFHTKLYKFTSITQPTWFIGSANCSDAIKGARHELMVRLRGRHAALDAYLRAIVRRADAVGSADGAGEVMDLRSFFLNGFLCFRPADRPSFTFQAFVLDPEHRRLIRERLAQATTVPHADPQTEGFGFDLVSAVESLAKARTALRLPQEETAAERQAVRFRHLAVETIYGYWSPAPLAGVLLKQAQLAKGERLEQLRVFARMLAEASMADLLVELDKHVEGLAGFFRAASLDLEPRPDCAARFRSFVEAKRALLDDDDRRERMANKLYVEPMPDIWHDAERARKFENSFFEDVAVRLDHPGRSRRIIEILRDELELGPSASPRSIRKTLEVRLADGLGSGLWNA